MAPPVALDYSPAAATAHPIRYRLAALAFGIIALAMLSDSALMAAWALVAKSSMPTADKMAYIDRLIPIENWIEYLRLAGVALALTFPARRCHAHWWILRGFMLAAAVMVLPSLIELLVRSSSFYAGFFIPLFWYAPLFVFIVVAARRTRWPLLFWSLTSVGGMLLAIMLIQALNTYLRLISYPGTLFTFDWGQHVHFAKIALFALWSLCLAGLAIWTFRRPPA